MRYLSYSPRVPAAYNSPSLPAPVPRSARACSSIALLSCPRPPHTCQVPAEVLISAPLLEPEEAEEKEEEKPPRCFPMGARRSHLPAAAIPAMPPEVAARPIARCPFVLPTQREEAVPQSPNQLLPALCQSLAPRTGK